MELIDLHKADLSAAKGLLINEVDFSQPKEKIVEAFNEEGITLKQILDSSPELRDKYASKLEPVPAAAPNLVTTQSTNPAPAGRPVIDKETIVSEPVNKVEIASNYLIKMERQNPHFEVAGYTFTQKHPYAVVSADKVAKVIQEGGFRQALPEEVQEYYDLNS